MGREHNVSPKNIVGAIANEAGIDSEFIGRIQIQGDHSFVDLPDGMPKDVFDELSKARVCGRPLKLSRAKNTHSSKGKEHSGGGDAPLKRHKSGDSQKKGKDKPKKPKHRGQK
ncbi:DbpA RNA binding domain-containing protein [Pseudomonadota bacterium]